MTMIDFEISPFDKKPSRMNADWKPNYKRIKWVLTFLWPKNRIWKLSELWKLQSKWIWLSLKFCYCHSFRWSSNDFTTQWRWTEMKVSKENRSSIERNWTNFHDKSHLTMLILFISDIDDSNLRWTSESKSHQRRIFCSHNNDMMMMMPSSAEMNFILMTTLLYIVHNQQMERFWGFFSLLRWFLRLTI